MKLLYSSILIFFLLSVLLISAKHLHHNKKNNSIHHKDYKFKEKFYDDDEKSSETSASTASAPCKEKSNADKPSNTDENISSETKTQENSTPTSSIESTSNPEDTKTNAEQTNVEEKPLDSENKNTSNDKGSGNTTPTADSTSENKPNETSNPSSTSQSENMEETPKTTETKPNETSNPSTTNQGENVEETPKTTESNTPPIPEELKKEENDEEVVGHTKEDLLRMFNEDTKQWEGTVNFKNFVNKYDKDFMSGSKDTLMRIGEKTIGFLRNEEKPLAFSESEAKNIIQLTRLEILNNNHLIPFKEFTSKFNEKVNRYAFNYNPYLDEMLALKEPQANPNNCKVLIDHFTKDRFSIPGENKFYLICFSDEPQQQEASKILEQSFINANQKAEVLDVNFHNVGQKSPVLLLKDKGFNVISGGLMLLDSSVAIYNSKDEKDNGIKLSDGFRYSIIKDCVVTYSPSLPQLPAKTQQFQSQLKTQCCLQYHIDFSNRDSNCKEQDLSSYICHLDPKESVCVSEIRQIQRNMISSCKNEKKAATTTRIRKEKEPSVTIPSKVEEQLMKATIEGNVQPIPETPKSTVDVSGTVPPKTDETNTDVKPSDQPADSLPKTPDSISNVEEPVVPGKTPETVPGEETPTVPVTPTVPGEVPQTVPGVPGETPDTPKVPSEVPATTPVVPGETAKDDVASTVEAGEVPPTVPVVPGETPKEKEDTPKVPGEVPPVVPGETPKEDVASTVPAADVPSTVPVVPNEIPTPKVVDEVPGVAPKEDVTPTVPSTVPVVPGENPTVPGEVPPTVPIVPGENPKEVNPQAPEVNPTVPGEIPAKLPEIPGKTPEENITPTVPGNIPKENEAIDKPISPTPDGIEKPIGPTPNVIDEKSLTPSPIVEPTPSPNPLVEPTGPKKDEDVKPPGEIKENNGETVSKEVITPGVPKIDPEKKEEPVSQPTNIPGTIQPVSESKNETNEEATNQDFVSTKIRGNVLETKPNINGVIGKPIFSLSKQIIDSVNNDKTCITISEKTLFF